MFGFVYCAVMAKKFARTERFICPLCGTWRCGRCGAERYEASRFAPDPLSCSKPNCGSMTGEMLIIRHISRGKAEDHRDFFDELSSFGAVPRYPA